MKDKDQYWNILKGLAIIAVVIGHAGAPFFGYVYMYHLALFFFISGYWYNDKHSITPTLYLGRRIKTLYLPYIFFNLLFLSLHNTFFKLGFFTDLVVDTPGIYPTRLYDQDTAIFMINDIVTLRNLDPLGAATWFYVALLSVTIIFCVTRYISLTWFKKPNVATIIIVLAFYSIGFILNSEQINLSFYLDIALIVLIVFAVGYFIRHYKININYNWWASLICLCVLYFVLNTFGQIEMSQRKFLNPILFLISSFSGIYINMYLGKIINKTMFVSRVISYIGEHSAAIMIFHFLVFKFVSVVHVKLLRLPDYYIAKFPIVSGDGGWWVIYSFCGVVVPVVVIYLFKYVRQNLVLIKNRKLRTSE